MRDAIQARYQVIVSTLRTNTDPRDKAFADVVETNLEFSNAAAMDLYSGKMSWGEYNKQRKNITDTIKAEHKRVYGG